MSTPSVGESERELALLEPVDGSVSVVYAGRERGLATPEGALVLSDWDVLPVHVAPVLDTAELLTILDPMSFPFDALRERDREIPVALRTPRGWGADPLIALLGEPVLERLTPLDRISVPSDQNWEALRGHYSWPLMIRLPERELLAFSPRLRADLEDDAPRQLKATFLRLGGAAQRQLLASRAGIPKGESERVVVLADNVELWASLFSLRSTRLTGIDPHQRHLQRARRSFPEWTFETELKDGDAETAHTTLSVMSLCRLGPRGRTARLESLLRTLRVGGRLVVLDRFLDGSGERAVEGPTPRQLLAEVQQAARGHLVLEHVETVRLRGEDLTSIGMLAFTKLGRPERL